MDRLGLLYDSSFNDALRNTPEVVQGLDFFEVIPDRYIRRDDNNDLAEVLNSVPIVFHSLNLSLGSDEPLNEDYVEQLTSLAEYLTPIWASDHLAITHIDGVELGNLSPLRFDTSAVDRIASKVDFLQAKLRVPFLVENIAYYFRIPGSEYSEAQFLQRLVEKTECGILLDLNNVAVNARNHDFDPFNYLKEIPLSAVQEIHIAGHRIHEDTYIDSHGETVADEVWDLLRFVASLLPAVNVILERDQDIPSLTDLVEELAIARNCIAQGRSGFALPSADAPSTHIP